MKSSKYALTRSYLASFLILLIGGVNAVELYDMEQANEKLTPILSALKNGIEKHDVSMFEEYVLFPLNISYEETYVTIDGKIKLKTEKVQHASELQERFNDIFRPTVIKLIDCITPEMMTYDRYRGFDAANGGIWFYDVILEDTGKRTFALSSISKNKTSTAKWVKEHCDKNIIQPTSITDSDD